MSLIFLFLLAILPRDDTLAETVDLVELHHFYDDNGKHNFDQLIFYDWCPSACRYQVRDFRVVRDTFHLSFDHKESTYKVRWIDILVGSKAPTSYRVITARSYRETWLQYDPELYEREKLPQHKRTPLRSP